MSELEELIGSIYAAERGPQVVACFDYDGTLITGYSATAFYRDRLRKRELGPIELTRTVLAARRGINSEADFAALLDLSLATWRGRTEEDVAKLGANLFKHDIGAKFHTEVWSLIQAHHDMEHTVVVASSATRFQVEPIAAEIGAAHLLYTPLEVVDGRLTGKVGGRALWGPGKSDALIALAAEHDYDLSASFAYSNGVEDVHLLESVGHPACIEPDPELTAVAEERLWPVLRCTPRGGRAGIGDLARTGAFYGGLLGGFAVGGAVGLLQRRRETMLDVGGGMGADIGLALAGVEVNVIRGHGNLWSSRPCVFIFNHQSKLDPIIVMKLVRERFTGVAKKEAKSIPVFGQIFQLAGVAFVDRGNTASARRSLEPAVAKVRDERISLIISPEGTRSVTPRLSRFKKGPFHIAMQAGVPIVPIVLRNVGEVQWRGAQIIKPGTVEVIVLEPIDTSEFTVDTLDEQVAAVRDLYIETLGHWPTSGPPRLLSGSETLA